MIFKKIKNRLSERKKSEKGISALVVILILVTVGILGVGIFNRNVNQPMAGTMVDRDNCINATASLTGGTDNSCR